MVKMGRERRGRGEGEGDGEVEGVEGKERRATKVIIDCGHDMHTAYSVHKSLGEGGREGRKDGVKGGSCIKNCLSHVMKVRAGE